MEGLVNISEFINHLKHNDLIIVSRSDYERRIDMEAIKLKQLQKKLLAKQNLTIPEIVKGQLLPVKTRQSINNWIDKGVFTDEEVFKDNEGTVRIVMCGINRVRELKNML